MLKHLNLLAAVCSLVIVAGCGTADSLSPSNLDVEVRSFTTTHAQTDSFIGTFRFCNKTPKSIRAEFGSSQWFDLVFYDSLGVERFHYNHIAYQILAYLELGPFGTHTDKLAFPFYALPPGVYRVHAWVFGHEDIYSETSIEVR